MQLCNDCANQLVVGFFDTHQLQPALGGAAYILSTPLYTWSVKLESLYYYQKRNYFQTGRYRFWPNSRYRGISIPLPH